MAINGCSINGFTINGLACRSSYVAGGGVVPVSPPVWPPIQYIEKVQKAHPQAMRSWAWQREDEELDETLQPGEATHIKILIEIGGEIFEQTLENNKGAIPMISISNLKFAAVEPIITITELKRL